MLGLWQYRSTGIHIPPPLQASQGASGTLGTCDRDLRRGRPQLVSRTRLADRCSARRLEDLTIQLNSETSRLSGGLCYVPEPFYSFFFILPHVNLFSATHGDSQA